MKSSTFILLAAATQLATFAQGTIVFANRNIPIASGGTTGGGNGNGTYNVPIFEYGTQYDGAGDLAGGFTVGLFLPGAPDGAVPLATSPLRTDQNSQFFAIGSQTVTIPGWEAGTTPTLTVRGWQGTAGFLAAKNNFIQYAEWTFTTKPLGGTPSNGGLPITPPSMTGWGPETGSGFNMIIIPEPTSAAFLGLASGAALLLRRRK